MKQLDFEYLSRSQDLDSKLSITSKAPANLIAYEADRLSGIPAPLPRQAMLGAMNGAH
jgi:hypothetical protein